jgi:Cu(I)/Ag(I) efflux system membrane fusion protein
MEKNIFEGSAVKTGQLLYRIADLSTLWVEAEIYESELRLVEMGQATNITLSYMPGRQFEGTVSYIYPYLNPETRTARIRIQAENTDGLLKPDMYTNVSIVVPLGERLIVPESAVMYAGRDHVVFVDLGDGRFQPRTIETGLRDEDWIEVLDGLSSGESVVTSANFLIAAESKLKSGLDKW